MNVKEMPLTETGFPADQFEFQALWDSCAGKISAYKECREIILEKASRMFCCGQDDEARLLRSVAFSFDKKITVASDEINEYIKESHRREEES